ncbi:MAG: LamG-like jellyroll fold domain-containing protein [Pedobacter sp.]
MTINKSKVSPVVTASFPNPPIYSNQIDVPVLIVVIDKDLISKNGACGNRLQDAEGRDISFALATAPTVPLNFQLDEYDPVTGRLACWVRISSLSADKTLTAATEIYFYYGGTVLHNPRSTTALQTWNSNYTKVWHMNAVSTQSGIHQMNLPLSNSGSTFTEGKIAKSAAFDGVSKYYTGGNEVNNAFTVSAWIKLNSLGTDQMIVTNDSSGMGGFQLKINAAGRLVAQTFNSLSPPVTVTGSIITIRETGRWYHVWGTLTTGDIKLYIDNAPTTSSANPAIRIGPGGTINIGSSKQNTQYFNGEIDEVRILKAMVTKEWMATCYENQNDPSGFYTIGAEEYSPGGFSRFTGTNTQWNVAGNWNGNVIPQANANILIPEGKKVVSSSANNYKSLIVQSGGTLEVSSDLKFTCMVDIASGGTVKVTDGALLRLGGDIRNNGQIISSGTTAKVIFEGLVARQEYDGTGLANISVLENNQLNTSNTLLLSAPMEVSGLINLKKGILQSDKTLIMKSASQTATAALLPIDPLLASAVGDVIVEQYISGAYPVPATARGWRLLSSPIYTSDISGTKSYDSRSFKDALFITGNGGVTNGFDISPANGATIYTHDQSLPGTLSQKYVGIKSIGQHIEFGKGVYIFSRGSRHVANAFISQIQTQPFINPQAYTIKHVGKLFIGEMSIPLASKDMGSIGDGFNLIGNPYASSLRWGDIGTEKTTRFIWQFDPLNAAYVVDDSPNVVIPSGTGFFVRLAAGEKSGKLTFSESSKFTSPVPSLPVLQSLKSSNNPITESTGSLKIILSKSDFRQAYVLKLSESGYDGINDMDALKIGEGHVSISSLVDKEQLSIDNRQPLKEPQVINLNVTGTETGPYTLLFETSLSKQYEIKLVDTYLQTEKQIKATDNTYPFSMDKTATGSMGALRFKVLIEQISKTTLLSAGIKVYPNPFNNNISIQIAEDLKEGLEIVMTDMLGKVVNKGHIEIGATLVPIDTQAFPKGFYLLQLINDKTKVIVTTLKLIKI